MPIPGESLVAAGIPPIHPGDVFNDRFIQSRESNLYRAAEVMHVDYHIISTLVERNCSVDRALAQKLGAFTGTSPMFWLNMQYAFDLAQLAASHESPVE